MPSLGHRTAPSFALAISAILALAQLGCAAGGGALRDGDSDGDDGDDGDSSAASSGAGGGTPTGSGGGTGTGTSSGTTGSGGGGAEASFVPCPHADFAARFDEVRGSLEAALGANGVKGGAIAIVCESEILAAGVGVVQSGGAPVTSSTQFQLASLTKMLTATAAVALAGDGTIEVGAPIADIMAELGYGDVVTLEHLLSHSSGLPLEFPSYGTDDLVGLILQNAGIQPLSAPGTKWEYSNLGYAVVGALLESASGEAFDDLVHDRVLDPIGMTGATMRVSEVLAGGDYAWGHSGATELGPEDSYYGSESYGPMGGAWASADALALYARSLLGNGPLAERLAQQMVPRIATGEYPGISYGYGLFIDDGFSPTIVYHSGSVEGFLSDMAVVPEAGIAAVVLVNDDAWFPGDITFQAIEAFVPLGY